MKTVSIAASFIVTVGLLGGCASHTSNPPGQGAHQHDHAENPPGPGGHGDGHTENPPGPGGHNHAHGDGHSNPPGPDSDAPHVSKNPPAPQGVSEHGHINPPAPKPVDEASLPAAADGEKVSKSADGSCWVAQTVDCPEGAACNPPAPKQVKCP